MEYKKEASSYSSLPAELFVTKESPPQPSTGIFASVFPPPSKVMGNKSGTSEMKGSLFKQDLGNQTLNPKQEFTAIGREGVHYSMPNKDRRSNVQEERVEPCHLSSSLYYGGQDLYSRSPSTQTPQSHPIFNKDGGEDDTNPSNPDFAYRGDWWQGSHESRLQSRNICNINKKLM